MVLTTITRLMSPSTWFAFPSSSYRGSVWFVSLCPRRLMHVALLCICFLPSTPSNISPGYIHRHSHSYTILDYSPLSGPQPWCHWCQPLFLALSALRALCGLPSGSFLHGRCSTWQLPPSAKPWHNFPRCSGYPYCLLDLPVYWSW